jgi:hypothetical protein
MMVANPAPVMTAVQPSDGLRDPIGGSRRPDVQELRHAARVVDHGGLRDPVVIGVPALGIARDLIHPERAGARPRRALTEGILRFRVIR